MIALILTVELLMIAANLVLPFSQDMALRVRAASIAREMQQVRDASLRARSGRTDWPVQPSPDAPPAEVTALLPAGFSFTHEDYRLVWNRWTVADGKQLGLKRNDVASVTVIADDPRLAGMVARELGPGQVRLSLADRTTLVVEGL